MNKVETTAHSPMEEMREHASEAAEFLKTLANSHRLLILCALLQGEKNVGQLNAEIDLSPSALSQHLGWLREADLVSTRREAQTIYYHITDTRVEKMIGLLKDLFCSN